MNAMNPAAAVARCCDRLSITVGPIAEPSPELAAAWDALAADAAETSAFAERWFLIAAARTLPGARDVRLLAVWDETSDPRRLMAVLPLTIAHHYGRIPLHHVTNWMHHHCFLGTPLIRAGCEREAWGAILTALDGADWVRGLFHVNGLVEGGAVHRGLIEAAAALGRPCDTVHRVSRAMLASPLSPSAYYERTVRKKKRKELKRLSSRLGELGTLAPRRLSATDAVGPWCDAFLALERSGWKGVAGSALASDPATEAFFREALAGAHAAGLLDIVRLDLDARPIAMLVNLIRPPGGFTFKIAFDEDFARFSPGVLVQIENLAVLARGDVAWMDSCAVEDHPMINSLWGERRAIVRVTVPLGGPIRTTIFHLCRTAERGSAAFRRLRTRPAA